MKRFNQKLDNYFTEKLIEKIKRYLLGHYVKVLFFEEKDNEGREYLYIKYNYFGDKELKNPKFLAKIDKKESSELLFNDNYFKIFTNSLDCYLKGG